jgi:hypothetical protein
MRPPNSSSTNSPVSAVRFGGRSLRRGGDRFLIQALERGHTGRCVFQKLRHSVKPRFEVTSVDLRR